MVNQGFDVGLFGDVADLDVDFVERRDELLEFGTGFVKGWLGDVCHEDVGAFFGEEDACFEADATGKRLVGPS